MRGGVVSTRIILDDLVNVFKEAWEQADSEGREGSRSRAGLEAVLEELLLSDGDVVIGQPSEIQGVILLVGDSLPVQVDDFVGADDLQDWLCNPIMRAVAVARLRTIADLLELPLGGEDE